MSERDARAWMWEEACALMVRAERLHRQFFQVERVPARTSWEPPVDIYETDDELTIVVALPGVAPNEVDVIVDGEVLTISGERRWPLAMRAAAIHRVELPVGRLRKTIQLPVGRFSVQRHQMINGCLQIGLKKMSLHYR